MPKAINVTISLDQKSLKIWENLPSQSRSAAVRAWLKDLDPITGEKKMETPADTLKKLLATEPSEAKSTKAQRYGRHTKMYNEMGTIIGKASTTYSKPCPTQTSDLTFFA